jgi:hypothetical protein
MRNKIVQFTTADINADPPVVKDGRVFDSADNKYQTSFALTPRYATQLKIINGSGVQLAVVVLSNEADRDKFNATNRYVDIVFPSRITDSTATGLANDATAYTASFALSAGSPQSISVVGSAAQTIADLITELNADLTNATAALSPTGNAIRITADNNSDWYASLWDSGSDPLVEGLGARASEEPFGPILIPNSTTFHTEQIGRIAFVSIRGTSGSASSGVNVELMGLAQ